MNIFSVHQINIQHKHYSFKATAAGTAQRSGPAVGHAELETNDDHGDENSILPWKSLSHRVNMLCYMLGVGRPFMVIRLELYLLILHPPDESG